MAGGFGKKPLRQTRSARQWKARTGTVLGVALVVGLYFTPFLFDRFVMAPIAPYLPGSDVPPPGFEAASAPLGLPPASTGSAAYSLRKAPDPNQPVMAYDPCRPIHYVVRPDGAPPGTDHLIREAVDTVSAATGLRFVADGPTDEEPSRDRKSYRPELYGKRWSPILIAWSTEKQSPELAGRIAGTGGSVSYQVPGEPHVYVTGQVLLDGPEAAELLSYPGGPAMVRAIMMHELGHVVGLDHVDDPTQLMFHDNVGKLEFGEGDLAGLALLGRGECVPGL